MRYTDCQNTEIRGLACTIGPGFESFSVEELKPLFRELPDSVEMLQLMQRSGFDGFNFHSIVVSQNQKPILFIPIYEACFNLSTFTEGPLKKLMSFMAWLLPDIFCPRVFGIGFVEGEWGAVGWDPKVNTATLNNAWDLALATLKDMASKRRIHLTGFLNFNTQSDGGILPLDWLKEYTAITGLPCAQLSLSPYQSVDDYLCALSHNTRKSLRKKLRLAKGIEIVRSQDPGIWIETIYKLYLDTLKRSDVSFGIQRLEFFKKVCHEVPGSEYVLYFSEKKLVAFNLLVRQKELLLDKYFCMEYETGRHYSLYFISWLENIRYCIENKIPLYHAGQTVEKTKWRLGTRFISSVILFRHRNPILHYLLTAFRNQFSYHPQIEIKASHKTESDPQVSFPKVEKNWRSPTII